MFETLFFEGSSIFSFVVFTGSFLKLTSLLVVDWSAWLIFCALTSGVADGAAVETGFSSTLGSATGCSLGVDWFCRASSANFFCFKTQNEHATFTFVLAF